MTDYYIKQFLVFFCTNICRSQLTWYICEQLTSCLYSTISGCSEVIRRGQITNNVKPYLAIYWIVLLESISEKTTLECELSL